MNEEQQNEALSLINQIEKLGVSKETLEELEDYKKDINEREFEIMDLRYLRALYKRLKN